MKLKAFLLLFCLFLVVFATPFISQPNFYASAEEVSSESGADSSSGSDSSADSGGDVNSGSIIDPASSLIFVFIVCVFLLWFAFGGKNS